jgi:hypothetical protein
MADDVFLQFINGINYDFTSITSTLDADDLAFLTAINYKNALDPGEVRSNARSGAVGTTTGQLKSNGSFEIHKFRWDALVQRLGPGYMKRYFDMTISYAETEMPTITDELIRCRIVGHEDSPKEGNEPPKVKVDLWIAEVRPSGISPVTDSLFD